MPLYHPWDAFARQGVGNFPFSKSCSPGGRADCRRHSGQERPAPRAVAIHGVADRSLPDPPVWTRDVPTQGSTRKHGHDDWVVGLPVQALGQPEEGVSTRSWSCPVLAHADERSCSMHGSESYGAASVSKRGGPGHVVAGRPDRPDCGRGAQVSEVLARERTVAVEANPRAISQMANVSSNNPPGMAATTPAPATPNSSSRFPAAKHA